MKKKLSLYFGNFAIAHPVCTTCYHKGLQPATQNAKKNKPKSQRLELMCDINLNENIWIKKLNKNHLTPPPFFLPKIFIKKSIKLKIKFHPKCTCVFWMWEQYNCSLGLIYICKLKCFDKTVRLK